MYKKILVPLDGSKAAESVLPHAKALAHSEGAEILLLNAAANPSMEFAFADPSIAGPSVREQEQKAREYMGKICDDLNNEGYKTSCHIGEGSPATAILKFSEEQGVDVIAMSTHGRSWPAKWLLGSVAERVVRYSKIPVMLIRAT